MWGARGLSLAAISFEGYFNGSGECTLWDSVAIYDTL